MTRRWKFGALSALVFAILSMPVAGFGQSSGVSIILPGQPADSAYHYERFFALTPKGEVYVLEFDTNTLKLIQSNQPVWSMPGVTAIAAASGARTGDIAGSFFAITSDRRIYFVDVSGAGAPRVRLLSTNAPADKNAIGYFGCHGTLYTIPSNGLLTTRELTDFDASHEPNQLSPAIQVGTGWNNVSSPQCVEAMGGVKYRQIFAIAANGVVVRYRHLDPKTTDWDQRNTDLRYLQNPAFPGVHIFSDNFVLEASYARGAGSTRDRVTQGVRVAGDPDSVNWPPGKAHVGVVTGGTNLLDFSQVVDDGTTYQSIG